MSTYARILSATEQLLSLPPKLDTSARLAAQNMRFGLARILAVLEQVDNSAEACFLASQDFTITRSSARWGSGFAYGGVLQIKSAEPIVFPGVRPNACGTLTGQLSSPRPETELEKNLIEFRGIIDEPDWDYGRKNHFINIYRERGSGDQYFIIHGCPASLKGDSASGPGLYLEKSKYWQKHTTAFSTPFGPVEALLGDAAVAYWRRFQQCEVESKAERTAVGEAVFGAYQEIANETHEGMVTISTYIHGCHLATDFEQVYPLLTTIGAPAYLVSANPNCRRYLSGLSGCYAGLLPHGLGYRMSPPGRLVDVRPDPTGNLLFRFEVGDGNAIYRNFAHVPFGYRSPKLVEEWSERNDLRIRRRLQPTLFTKL